MCCLFRVILYDSRLDLGSRRVAILRLSVLNLDGVCKERTKKSIK